jgi:hypothetical protein
VDAHPHADLGPGRPSVCHQGFLSVDEAPVLIEQGGVVVAQRLDQACRTLDVRE